MKKIIKEFVMGVIISTLLMGTVLGAGVKKTIEVAFNSINLTVNGNKVNADNIVYEGTTYVPLRVAGELLGKDVSWNGNTNTASIDDKMISYINNEEIKKIYEDDKITITYPNVWKVDYKDNPYYRQMNTEAEFTMENKTDGIIMPYIGIPTVNGLTLDSVAFTPPYILPGHKEVIDLNFEIDGDVKTISGKIRMYDGETWNYEGDNSDFDLFNNYLYEIEYNINLEDY